MARSRRRTALTLTDAAKAQLKALELSLAAALGERPEVEAAWRAEHAAALRAKRTGLTWVQWRAERITQVGASWILSCVFVRFAEDRGLVEPLISGRFVPDDRRLSRHDDADAAQQAYIAANPTHGAAEWLQEVFRRQADLPGLAALLDQEHALLWRLAPTPEGARSLLNFWRERDPDTNQVRWLFDDATPASASARPPGANPAAHAGAWHADTRFLGDLYQDLSESARKTYALLQTPEFVEEFILDRTLEPAIGTFGLEVVTLIDPTCGSGHFLLGAFRRLLAHWTTREPGTDIRERVHRSLAAIAGVDINPFAAAIARYRLLLEALAACGIRRLADAPAFPIQVAVGDSLLHGPLHAGGFGGIQQSLDPEHELAHLYRHERPAELMAILSRQYHAVVGNPPYITPKDKAANKAYRPRFPSCAGKYALSVPFMERFMDLAVTGDETTPAGFVGKITSNSFMKREFGKKLVEQFMPRWDLTTMIDTSGAYIPGHGTPTTILFLRHQRPTAPTVRAALGIRGEPETPSDPANGLVWRAIVDQIDHPGSSSDFISVDDRARESFQTHPWSIGGGGAAELVEEIQEASERAAAAVVDSIGITCFTLEDDAFIRPTRCVARSPCEPRVRPLVEGDLIRDWSISIGDSVLFPYTEDLNPDTSVENAGSRRALWPFRACVSNNKMFGGRTKLDDGLAWFEFGRLTANKYCTPLSIAFAFVATHNHFVLDRGGKVFKQSAPVIKMPPDATEAEHLALLELLNSSLACFWMQAVFHNKGGPGGGCSKDEKWHDFYEHDSTKLKNFPLPGAADHWRTHGLIATRLDTLAAQRSAVLPSPERLRAMDDPATALAADRAEAGRLLGQMIAWQEELDWAVYHSYGLVDDADATALRCPDSDLTLPPVALGERAFEIVMARQVAAGTLKTTWFARHGSTPITEPPAHWPAAYRAVVLRRIERIESDQLAPAPGVALIETPQCKRRWNLDSWDEVQATAVREALLDAVEALPEWRDEQPAPISVASLADRMERDPVFMRLLRLAAQPGNGPAAVPPALPEAGDADAPNVVAALAALMLPESVPFLPVLRFTQSGLDKHAEWLECWGQQRIEDPYLTKMESTLTELFGSEPAQMAHARKLLVRFRDKGNVSMHGERDIDPNETARRREVLTRHEAIDRDRRRALDPSSSRSTPIVPPKYRSADFLTSDLWKLRGALDVPKERFIAYGTSSRGTTVESMIFGWAGWTHAQQAAALVHLTNNRSAEGDTPEQLAPLLQGILHLIPWLHQWHATPQQGAHDGNLGDAYAAWLEQKLHELGLTREMIERWGG